MTNAIKINKNLFNIYTLFTREPFAQYFSKEIEYYTNENRNLIGLISLDLTDNDFTVIILSRDQAMQYRAEFVEVSIGSLEKARMILDEKMGDNKRINCHEHKKNFFDIFKETTDIKKQHPIYKQLKNNPILSAAKEVIKEIAYHYNDIDGNFIEQFQSFNGFDARIWELYLYAFFREQYFSFKRNFNAPDYIIEKLNQEIAVEAVIVGNKASYNQILATHQKIPTQKEVIKKLSNDVPLLFGSALYRKLKKKYWEKDHIKNKPFVIAIADFHEIMSMSWTYNALVEYLYGYKYDYIFDEKQKLHVIPKKIGNYIKPNGTEIPSGFFFQPSTENISAVIFSTTGTLSKFNRMGKQAGLGSNDYELIRMGIYYNHSIDAIKPNFIVYKVDENSNETWSEGVIIYHNPRAKIPLSPGLFDNRVAQAFFDLETKLLYTKIPRIFPYGGITLNIHKK